MKTVVIQKDSMGASLSLQKGEYVENLSAKRNLVKFGQIQPRRNKGKRNLVSDGFCKVPGEKSAAGYKNTLK